MRVIVFLMFYFTITTSIISQDYIALWPSNKMPNSKGLKLEHIEERERITQVQNPKMLAFFTSKEENQGSAILICPPGGYQKLTYNIAGIQLAKWFNTLGINAFVLIYRLPNSPDLKLSYLGPIQDAQRGIKLIRANAEKWGISSEKIGVMGCSAGGHLAALASTCTIDYSQIGDTIDKLDYKPNFQILVSPVISLVKNYHSGSRKAFLGDSNNDEMAALWSNENNVTSNTPIAFMAHADNDKTVNSLNSIFYYQALKAAGVKASIHIYPEGGHSIALRNNPGSTNTWTITCEEWLKENRIIVPKE